MGRTKTPTEKHSYITNDTVMDTLLYSKKIHIGYNHYLDVSMSFILTVLYDWSVDVFKSFYYESLYLFF